MHKNFFLIVFVAVGVAFYHLTTEQTGKTRSASAGQPGASQATSQIQALKPTPPSPEQVEQGLSVAANLMKNLGFEAVPPAVNSIQYAIESGDFTKVRVAFNEITYHGMYSPQQVIAAFEHFLPHENPKVRFLAAKHLFIVGSKSGLPVLIELMKSNEIVDGGYGSDLRIQAAEVLGKFRVKEALNDIISLYNKTDGKGLFEPLTFLEQKLPNQESFKFRPNENLVRKYVVTGMSEYLPEIQQVFEKTSKPGDKLAAAWALVELDNNEGAFNFLKGQASTTSPPQCRSISDFCQALKYIGTLDRPESKEILISALDSEVSAARQIAVVNLIYNQGEVDKGLEAIAYQLNNSSKAKMPWEFTYYVASQFQDHPLIKEASANFVKNSGRSSWRMYSVNRKDWPIYNWIDEFVVKLKEPR